MIEYINAVLTDDEIKARYAECMAKIWWEFGPARNALKRTIASLEDQINIVNNQEHEIRRQLSILEHLASLRNEQVPN